MRLTNILLYYIRRRHVPGKIDIGKNRIVQPVTSGRKKKAMKQMVAEQRNMDVLSTPYLTKEEDHRHEWDMGLRQEEHKQRIVDKIEKSWLEHRHMEGYYAILEKKRNWE